MDNLGLLLLFCVLLFAEEGEADVVGVDDLLLGLEDDVVVAAAEDDDDNSGDAEGDADGCADDGEDTDFFGGGVCPLTGVLFLPSLTPPPGFFFDPRGEGVAAPAGATPPPPGCSCCCPRELFAAAGALSGGGRFVALLLLAWPLGVASAGASVGVVGGVSGGARKFKESSAWDSTSLRLPLLPSFFAPKPRKNSSSSCISCFHSSCLVFCSLCVMIRYLEVTAIFLCFGGVSGKHDTQRSTKPTYQNTVRDTE